MGAPINRPVLVSGVSGQVAALAQNIVSNGGLVSPYYGQPLSMPGGVQLSFQPQISSFSQAQPLRPRPPAMNLPTAAQITDLNGPWVQAQPTLSELIGTNLLAPAMNAYAGFSQWMSPPITGNPNVDAAIYFGANQAVGGMMRPTLPTRPPVAMPSGLTPAQQNLWRQAAALQAADAAANGGVPSYGTGGGLWGGVSTEYIIQAVRPGGRPTTKPVPSVYRPAVQQGLMTAEEVNALSGNYWQGVFQDAGVAFPPDLMLNPAVTPSPVPPFLPVWEGGESFFGVAVGSLLDALYAAVYGQGVGSAVASVQSNND